MLRIALRGLVACALGFWLVGCESGQAPPTEAPASSTGAATGESGHDHEGHSHAETGPHGGHIIVLGDEQAHAELLHDEATHTVTVHLLDAQLKEPVAIDEKAIALQIFEDGKFVDYTLAAAPAAGEAAGASQFSVTDEKLADALLHAEEVKGRLRVTIDGKELVGQLDHAAHDHEGHDHAADDHAGHDHAAGDHEGHDHEGHQH